MELGMDSPALEPDIVIKEEIEDNEIGNFDSSDSIQLPQFPLPDFGSLPEPQFPMPDFSSLPEPNFDAFNPSLVGGHNDFAFNEEQGDFIPCPVCPKKFKAVRNFQEHLKTHNMPKLEVEQSPTGVELLPPSVSGLVFSHVQYFV